MILDLQKSHTGSSEEVCITNPVFPIVNILLPHGVFVTAEAPTMVVGLDQSPEFM